MTGYSLKKNSEKLQICARADAGRPHHGYAAFVTENRITIEGDLQELRLANPHVIMKIRTADSTVYSVSWQSALWVEVHELASLREVRRPSDGWVWHANYR